MVVKTRPNAVVYEKAIMELLFQRGRAYLKSDFSSFVIFGKEDGILAIPSDCWDIMSDRDCTNFTCVRDFISYLVNCEAVVAGVR